MALLKTRDGYNSEFYPTAPDELDYFLGNFWEKQIRILEVKAETVFIATASNTVEYRPLGYANRDGLINNLAQGFSDFRIGDTISIVDTDVPGNSGYVGEVIEILNSGLIRVFPDLPAPSPVTSTNAVITVTTQYEGISYWYNLVANNEAVLFNSKIDFEEQKLTFDAYAYASTAVETMEFNGIKSYQIGTVTVERTTTLTNKFKITHEFYILPVILPGQWSAFIAGNAPSWFAAQNALRMVNRVTLSKDLNDPIRFQTADFTPATGNTGWYNENFNSGINNYNVTLVEYYNNISNTLIPEGLKLTTDEIRVEITIVNTNNSPFVDGATKFTLNFQRDLPTQADILPTLDYTENFLFDRNAALQTVAAVPVPVAGQNFGGTEQVFKEISATYISATEIKVIGVIAMSPENVAKIEGLNNKRYILAVITQEDGLAVEQSDRETILADANTFFLDDTTPSLVTYNTKFIEHPFTDFVDGLDDLYTFKQDEVLVKSLVSFDETQILPGQDVTIVKIKSKVISKNIAGDVQVLETFTNDLSGSPLVSSFPTFDVLTQRSFVIPTTEERKNIRYLRRADLDSGTLKVYELIYPFRCRWEAFKPLSNLTISTSFQNDFYDITEANNGLNHDWGRVAANPDWGVYVRTEIQIRVSSDGSLQTFVEDLEFTIDEYLANPDWTSEIIRYYNAATAALLPSNIVLLSGNTLIKADFEYTGGTPPIITDLEGVLYIGRDQIDPISNQRSLSSVYNREAVSWFISILGNGLVKISNVSGNLWRLEAEVDNTKIPTDAPLCIVARIYDTRIAPVIPADAKLLEDGQPKLLEDGQFKLLD
jgi:hypothetical protein